METQTDFGLYAHDIRDLRRAITIGARHNGTEGILWAEVKSHGVKHWRRWNVDSVVYAYRRKKPRWSSRVEHATCRSLITTYGKFEHGWSSVLRLLRTGDQIKLEWSADNNNGYFDKANETLDPQLHLDNLHASIVRNGKVHCRVLVDFSICPDNDARMISSY